MQYKAGCSKLVDINIPILIGILWVFHLFSLWNPFYNIRRYTTFELIDDDVLQVKADDADMEFE